MDLLLTLVSGPAGYAVLLVLLLLCGVGNPLPEDAVLIAGGYLIYTGVLQLVPTVAVCYCGVVCGDAILYYIGRRYGQQIITHPRFHRIIPPDRVDRIRKNFQRWGHWTILFARFLVGLRAPTFLLSGVMHVRWRTFLLFDAIGALVSVPLFVGLGFLFGNNVDALRHDVSRVQHWLLAAGVVSIVGWLFWIWRKTRREEARQDILKPAAPASVRCDV